MITAGAQMSGNPLAPEKDLDGSRGAVRSVVGIEDGVVSGC
jgi:hypothetical protein